MLGAFLSAVTLIVFLQFNSNRSINQLIDGNENLLSELSLKNNLQALQTQIISLESKVRGTVINDAVIDKNHLQEEISNINQSLKPLQALKAGSSTRELVTQLELLINAKIDFNKEVISTFSSEGKAAAEKIINTQLGRKLADSIKVVSSQLEDLRQQIVTDLIKKADDEGRRAKTLGTLIALIAAAVSVFTFIYVSYKVREQQLLIARLNESEKKAKEAARIKENFLANMSHEIRTPMNALLGFTNLLQRKRLDDESRQYVQSIQKSGENLLTIVNDILDLSKIEAGMMRIESVPFSIRGLLHSVETMFIPKAKETKIEFQVSVDDTLNDSLEGDPVRLTQILVNLIGNAIKFTNEGKVTVQVVNKGVSNEFLKVGIKVSDTGIGIKQEKLAHIFERFQQAEDSVTRKYGGTGLGLAIVKDLVLLQQGTIDVKSKPGQGTSFELVIPYKIAENQVAPKIGFNNVPSPPSVFKNIKVLVVEDNEINQSLIRHLFSGWQLNCDLATNGREALEALRKRDYDLILMDIQMPEMDGYTAATEIRKTLAKTTPIIAMTAHALPGEREKCISFGMNEYISKPIREEKLYKLIVQFTGLTMHPGVPDTATNESGNPVFHYINLDYMKEVSRGNKEYEKEVTSQFLEAMPDEIGKLELYWNEHNNPGLRQVAHNMRTTISVVGLSEKLQPHLDTLEYGDFSKEDIPYHISVLKKIGGGAIEEAELFYRTL